MIDNNRIQHMLGVAYRCAELAEERGFSPADVDKMFILGLLHDVGYLHGDNPTHADKGADMLEEIGFPYTNAVRMHGKPIPASEMDDVLKILNQADIETDFCGQWVSAKMRLRDVALRYGINSKQYIDMNNLIVQLGLFTGFPPLIKK